MAQLIALTNQNNNQNDLAINLRRLLDNKNISEAELARQTSIPQPTLHKILSGATSDPRASTLKSLAEYFDISIDDLMSGTATNKRKSDQKCKIQSVAIISWDDCLDAKNFLSKLTPSTWHQWIVTEFVSSNTFALISKPSMEPKFPKGSILIIDPDADPEDGDLVIVQYKDTKQATIRELCIDGPIRTLSTISKSSTTAAPYDSNIQIIGIIVKSIFTFE